MIGGAGGRPGRAKHKCPGCPRHVDNTKLACPTCWHAIPPELQRRVYATARLSPVEPRRMDVLRDVVEFFAGRTAAAAPAPPTLPGFPGGETREDEP